MSMFQNFNRDEWENEFQRGSISWNDILNMIEVARRRVARLEKALVADSN